MPADESRAHRPISLQACGRWLSIFEQQRPSGSVKTYQGSREIDGIKVTVDGRPLDEHYEIKQFTKWGFEWTYEGASPRQLALAILYDHLGDKDRAIDLCDPFM